MLGVLSDFNNSVTRYILNNFYDGYKQDGLNLLQGEYTVPSTLVIKDVNRPLTVKMVSLFFYYISVQCLTMK
jgi:hypothetical protein